MISHCGSTLRAQIDKDISDNATASLMIYTSGSSKVSYLILDVNIMNIYILITNLAKSVGQSEHGSSDKSLIETEIVAEIPKLK